MHGNTHQVVNSVMYSVISKQHSPENIQNQNISFQLKKKKKRELITWCVCDNHKTVVWNTLKSKYIIRNKKQKQQPEHNWKPGIFRSRNSGRNELRA